MLSGTCQIQFFYSNFQNSGEIMQNLALTPTTIRDGRVDRIYSQTHWYPKSSSHVPGAGRCYQFVERHPHRCKTKKHFYDTSLPYRLKKKKNGKK